MPPTPRARSLHSIPMTWHQILPSARTRASAYTSFS
uniref:Uncharacterized protein n=1 Tax=Arundo donax TaxID=35708 RepID=A0A0A8ZDV7_ARUDO